MRNLTGTIIASIVAIIAILMLVPSCGILGSEEGEFQPIQSLVLFKISDAPQQTDDDTGTMQLELITVKKYGCQSCRVISDLQFRADTVVIQLYGVHIPENCNNVVGPAHGLYYLDLDEGHHSILFQHGQQSDVYDLDISSRTIKITSDVTHVTRPVYNIVQR